MKTTVDISSSILRKAKQFALMRKTTLKFLIERGLREVLSGPAKVTYRLKDKSVGGKGLQPPFDWNSWEEIRDLAYGKKRGNFVWSVSLTIS
jgi:hypothetical protein